MKREEVLKQSEVALQQLVAALQQGRSETRVQYRDTLSRFHRYSFGNCTLIAVQKQDATLVAGFNRWKDLGRFVRKSEQVIAFTDQLDTDLDWTTFRLTELGCGDQVFAVPNNTQHYDANVPMTYDGVEFEVQIEAGIRSDTGQVCANFYSIDPARACRRPRPC